ncbi:hypothetical protein H9655_04880 [Cytobacillus sp. Sa5YUA1]|uniref:Uncharacterized protein n=1 Tax=Cytobacillus stercorigallinarum TaxID=2762240 RepID=A0ABR8QLX6_9BACI|nr:hypothetical protein [Cytobacillus stercorigallinarum]MBD7936352.1 hypothetical protein [Cytobacillus stercorigallinarum]
MEKEYLGKCSRCGEGIYCHGGFLGGVLEEDGKMTCFSCIEEEKVGYHSKEKIDQ